MRFYSGDHSGKMTHHDVAMVENPNLPRRPRMGHIRHAGAINHVAIALPDRDSWLQAARLPAEPSASNSICASITA